MNKNIKYLSVVIVTVAQRRPLVFKQSQVIPSCLQISFIQTHIQPQPCLLLKKGFMYYPLSVSAQYANSIGDTFILMLFIYAFNCIFHRESLNHS